MEANLRQLIQTSPNIMFFGGAGVSTESGIPDFNSPDGLYRQRLPYPPQTILSHDFFMRRPEDFYDFYRQRMLFPQAQPNAAHLALAKLERTGKLQAVITQNIDGLHQKAGSRSVHELHGSVHRNHCQVCHAFYDLSHILHSSGLPRCTCGGLIKPDVVLYGEALPELVTQRAIEHIRQADLLIVGGTSLSVYPAAGMIDHYRGDKLVLINQTPTGADHRAALCLRQPIGQTLKDACS